MALEEIKSRLKRLDLLVEGWNDDDISAIERDLALEHLRAIYDSLSTIDCAAARPQLPAVQDAGGTTDVAVVPAEIAETTQPTATPEPPLAEQEPATLIDDPIDIDALLGLSLPDDKAEPTPLSPAEPETTAVPTATEPEAEPAAISEVEPDPIVEPEPAVEIEEEPAAEPKEPAIAEAVAVIETVESIAAEPEKEIEPSPEPVAAEPVAVESVATESVAAEPVVAEPTPQPEKAPMGGLFDINEIPIRAKRRRNVMISLYEEPAKPLVRDDSPVATAAPAAYSTPVTAMPAAAEVDEVRADDSREEREPAPEPGVAESVAEPTAVEAEESVVVESAGQTVEPDALPEQSSVQPQPKRYAASVTPTPAQPTRLADVLGEEVTTLADSMIDDRSAVRTAATMRIDDLRSAIGINDKFLMIRDLFNGDGQMYENTITTLNEFDDLDECMIYIVENFAWNPDSDGARLLMSLIQRKLA